MKHRLIAVGLVFVALVAAAPTLVSWVAPVLIERGFEHLYAGSIEVASVRLGWWTGTRVGPIEVFDGAGAAIGEVAVEADASLGRMVRERWWSDEALALGDVYVRGGLDLEFGEDGRSNLQRAVASRGAKAPGALSSRESPEASTPRPIEVSLHLDSLHIAVKDQLAPSGSPLHRGVVVRQLSGAVLLDFIGSEWRTHGSLHGRVVDGVESRALAFDAKADADWNSGGALSRLNVAVDASGIPIAAIDGLAGMHGALVHSIGSTAEAKVRVVDDGDRWTLAIDATAPGALVDLALERSDGIVSATRGSRVQLDSFAFLAALGAGSNTDDLVEVTTWPSLVVELGELRFPAGELFRDRVIDPRSIDWRGAELALTAESGELVGRIKAQPGAAEPYRELVVEPSRFTIEVEEADSGLTIRGGVRALLAGRSAGEATLDVALRDLLDEKGRYGGAWTVESKLVQTGVAAEILQLVADRVGLAIDAKRDIGETVDRIVISARSLRDDSKGADGGIEIDIQAHAANFDLTGQARWDARSLRTQGDGVVFRLGNAGPLVEQATAFFTSALPPGMLRLGKNASALLKLTDFRFDRSASSSIAGLDSGRLTLTLSDLSDEPGAAEHLSPVEAEVGDYLREAFGGALSLEAEVAQRDPAHSGDLLRIRAAIQGQGFDAKVEASWSSSEVRIDRAATTFEIAPERANRLLGATSGHPISVRKPFHVVVEPQPLRFDRVAGGSLPSGDVRLSVKGTDVEMENLPLIDPARRLAIELEGGLSVGRPGGHVAATLKGRVKGRRDDGDFDYGVVDAAIDYEPGGELAAEIGLSNLGAAIADVVPVGAGEIREAVGENPEIAIHLRRETPASKLRLDLDLSSSRIEAKNLHLSWDDHRIYLSEPERIVWKPSPEFVGRKLTGRDSALRNAPSITLELDKLVLAREREDGSSGTFRPGVFALDASLSTPLVVFTTWSGSEARASDVVVDLAWVESERGFAFDLNTAKMAGVGGEQMKPSKVHAVLAGAVDSGGSLSFPEATLTAQGELWDFPSAIIDSIADLDGLTAQTLGPNLGVGFDTAKLSKHGGTLKLDAKGEMGEASVRGEIRDETLVVSEPVRVELSEIRSELVAKLLVGLPLIASFEKKPQDGPATITVEGLRAPIDGDLRKLNGIGRVSLGRVRFKTDALLGKVLKVGGAEGAPTTREFSPFVITAKDGVLTYEKYSIPIGGDEIEASGTVDLVQREIDMILYVPHVMLAEYLVGEFKTGLSGLISGTVPFLNSLLRMPLRVRGPIDDPKVTPDIAVFVQENEGILEGAGRFLLDLPGRLPIFRRD